ncbi:MAG: MBL fold metallo-hydrolase [Kiritimatiellae bacterium]|nr:MBL fold metallo-hydrolase [Kiritimatiellia bacterium]
MPLTVCILASGSSGNCTFLRSGQTRVLIDAGISAKAIAERLAQIGEAAEQLDAICVTHEHDDHTSALNTMQRRYRLGLYANSGTIEGVQRSPQMRNLAWQVFATGQPFTIGDLRLAPFSVPHDAYDPVGFIVQNGDTQVGVVTDMGIPTGLIRERLRPCRALVLESNHDPAMLQDATRPWSLKQRIAGRHGHLSNEKAAEMLAEIASPTLIRVFLAHLSKDCNRPERALKTVTAALARAGHAHIEVRLTYADRISEVWNSELGPT